MLVFNLIEPAGILAVSPSDHSAVAVAIATLHLASDWAVGGSISGQGSDKETAILSCVCHPNGDIPVVYMRCNTKSSNQLN